jgi:alanyl aminopeptidase
VLRTIERWVGDDLFLRGIREYLTESAWKSVQADRLFSALDRASGKNVSQMAAGFVDKPGVPVVSLQPACERGARWNAELTQEPWRPLGSKMPEQHDRTWTIPVCVRPQGEKKSTCAELSMGAPSLVAGQGRCPAYIHPNAEGGYYRFSLEEKEFVRLAEARAELDVAARVSLLSNAWAAVRAGKLEPKALVKILPAFDDDGTRQTAGQVVTILAGASRALVEDDARAAFQKFSLARLAKRKKELGWLPKKDENPDDALLRRDVLAAMGDLAEDDPTLREAEEHAAKWLADPTSIDADSAAVALDLASRRAGESRLDELHRAMQAAKTREDRLTALRATMGFDDTAVLGKALDATLRDEVHANEMRYVFSAVFTRRKVRLFAEGWVKSHWDDLRKKLPGSLGRVLVTAASAGCDRAELAERAAFYEPRIAEIEGAARRLAEAMEAVSLCAELRGAGAASFGRALSSPAAQTLRRQ